jgi:transposase
MMNRYLVFLVRILVLTTTIIASLRYSSSMQDASKLPTDLSTAQEVILVQSESLIRLDGENKSLKKDNEELRAHIRFLMSGKKREKFINADQLLIEFQEDKELQAALEAARKEAEEELQKISYQRQKTKKQRKPPAEALPSHLPREEVEVSIPADFQKRIDARELFIKRFEYAEALKHIPAKLVVLRYKMPVLAYVGNPERELLVENEVNLGEKGQIHPSVPAHVATSKFAMHLPLYRLQDIFASSGLTLSRSSLDYHLDLAHEATQEINKVMLSRLLSAYCIGFDDTHTTLIMPSEVPDLDPENEDLRLKRLIEKMQEARKEKKDSLDAKMWGYTSFDPKVPYEIFDFRVSRHRDGPEEILDGYAGHVMADCYSGNLAVVLDPDSKMTRMACWAHARRKVYEHADNDTEASSLPLALINKLYDIERRAMFLSDEARCELRSTESRMYLDRLRDWLDGPIAANLLPASKLAGAFNYIRNHWEALNVFVTDGRLPIDNNQGERMMRKVAVGRKNWLFVGSMRAGIRNAGLMSLVASALRNDLDVHAYLESAITHMIRGTARPAELLPDVWKSHHPEAIRKYREEEHQYKATSAVEQAARRRARSELKKAIQS